MGAENRFVSSDGVAGHTKGFHGGFSPKNGSSHNGSVAGWTPELVDQIDVILDGYSGKGSGGNSSSMTRDIGFRRTLLDHSLPRGAVTAEIIENGWMAPLSIGDMLAWKPRALVHATSLHVDQTSTFNPSRYALSRFGSREVRTQMHGDVTEFLADVEIAKYIEELFYVQGKSFRKRSPLQIETDADRTFGGEGFKNSGRIFNSPSTSFYFVLKNEFSPIASVGINQFEDGVDIVSLQGVNSSKIGRRSAEDLHRIKNWPDRLVALVEKYAAHQGLDYVMIIPAGEDIWSGKFPIERAEKIYNQTAADRNYDFNPKLRRFIKKVK